MLLAGLLFATAPASSQSADVLRKLHARYDSVSQFDDGLAVVKQATGPVTWIRPDEWSSGSISTTRSGSATVEPWRAKGASGR